MASDHTTPHYSTIASIQKRITDTLDSFAARELEVTLKQELPYGTQLAIAKHNDSGLINVYYSKKKGLSFVDCSKNSVSREAIALLQGKPFDAADRGIVGTVEHELKAWIGTDESGKGDFFGPLVVAGFYTTRANIQNLLDMGVCDSKKLSSDRIESIAHALRRTFPDCISVIVPSVQKYNELYARMRNMNRLLAWGHARAIANLINGTGTHAGKDVDGVVADQFGDEAYIRNGLKDMKSINLIQRPRAESNPAVAAASIIARDCFERQIRKLGAQFKMQLPLGASAQVIAAAKKFAAEYGMSRLHEVAKMHFKTAREIA